MCYDFFLKINHLTSILFTLFPLDLLNKVGQSRNDRKARNDYSVWSDPKAASTK